MKGAWRIGRIGGIPIQIHWSFLLILLWSVYRGSEMGGGYYIVISLVITLLLFLCVFLHELGHSFMAKYFGVLTRSITLLPVGGIAALDRIPERPREELLIAIAGPMVNVVIVAALYVWLGRPDDLFVAEPVWDFSGIGNMVILVNVMMIVFNMIPAFPMDGGRVFRALLAIWLPYPKATAIASAVGQSLAVVMMAAGLTFNPFLFLIGIMIFMGAKGENRWVHLRSLLEGVTVRDLMQQPQAVLSPDVSLAQCAEIMNQTGQRDFIVMEHERIVGVLPQQVWVKHYQDPEHPITAGMVMKLPAILVAAAMPAAGLFKMISSSRQDIFPVTEDGKLAGFITSRAIKDIYVHHRIRVQPTTATVHRPRASFINVG
jgi:Zn-dependent protease